MAIPKPWPLGWDERCSAASVLASPHGDQTPASWPKQKVFLEDTMFTVLIQPYQLLEWVQYLNEDI